MAAQVMILRKQQKNWVKGDFPMLAMRMPSLSSYLTSSH